LNVNKILSSNSEAIITHYLALIILEIRLVIQLAVSEFSENQVLVNFSPKLKKINESRLKNHY
jgi:hypothetical protein